MLPLQGWGFTVLGVITFLPGEILLRDHRWNLLENGQALC